MWDLDQIIQQNNQAAIDYMMRGRKVDIAQSPQPQNWSLSMLAEKLKVGPPLLAKLLDSFTNIEALEGFLGIIREFLPEHEEEILWERGRQRVYRFCYLFTKKYYPLPSYASDIDAVDLVSCLPVELMAMTYSAYHDLDIREGYLLLLSLVIYPYEGDWRDEEDDSVPFNPLDFQTKKYKPSASDIDWLRNLVESLTVGGEWFAPMGFSMVKIADNKIVLRDAKDTPEVKEVISRTLLVAKIARIEAEYSTTGRTSLEKLNGARIPLIDKVRRHVGEETATLIPAGGWTPPELHKMTDGTKYEGVGTFADWACSSTGCAVLDSGYDSCAYIEGMAEPVFKWTRYNVDTLTKQWPKVLTIRQKIDNIVEWVEVNPIVRFRDLLDFLTAQPKLKLTKSEVSKNKFSDPMDNYCILDMKYEEEDDDGN